MLSDTMMFQRFPTHEGYDDHRLSNFYGMALPFVKRGIPIDLVQMENLLHDKTLDDIRVLVMSYANMKPLREKYHQRLVDWVKKGGCLIYIGRDNDPFQSIREWWNQGEHNYKAPSHHLFHLAGIEIPSKDRTLQLGKGRFTILRQNPKELAYAKDGGQTLINLVKNELKQDYNEQNFLKVERGPYDIIGVLEESVSEKAYTADGPVIDLYDPNLPVLSKKVIHPSERALLYNLNRSGKTPPSVLAAASRASDAQVSNSEFSIVMKAPADTQGIARLLFESKPKEISIQNHKNEDVLQQSKWDTKTKTLLVRYPNSPEGVHMKFTLQ